jgi:hypothetical protein
LKSGKTWLKPAAWLFVPALALPQVRAKQNGGLMPFLFIISELHVNLCLRKQVAKSFRSI